MTENSLRLGIMQPYFLPYIGYFQLIAMVDKFIVYDNIKYTKKGWINRNRILTNGSAKYITLPLKKDSDYLDIRERELSPTFSSTEILNQIRGAYTRAPFFKATYPVLDEILNFQESNLFKFILNSLHILCDFIGIKTPIIVSSQIESNSLLSGVDRVLSCCADVGASHYINPIGGRSLYDHQLFLARGINLEFIAPNLSDYKQFNNVFVPGLSIIDVLMFNSVDSILDNYLKKPEI